MEHADTTILLYTITQSEAFMHFDIWDHISIVSKLSSGSTSGALCMARHQHMLKWNGTHTWIHGHIDTCRLAYIERWLYGYNDTWIHRYMIFAWLLGHFDASIPWFHVLSKVKMALIAKIYAPVTPTASIDHRITKSRISSKFSNCRFLYVLCRNKKKKKRNGTKQWRSSKQSLKDFIF